MSELLYNKSKAVEELNKVEGFYPLELARVISNEGQEEQRYLDVKYRKLWFRLVNPTGKIISRIVHFTENMAVVEARIYLDKCDQEDNYIANSFSQKFRTADTQFGDKFLEMAETAAIGRALADAGYGLQFADVGEGNDPMQVDAGIPVNQGTQMQTAMPAQTPAPGMQQTPNQSAGTMPSFPPQVIPGQQMMEQFYQEAQAGNLALCKAAMNYDNTRPFAVYARVAIRNAIYSYWRKLQKERKYTCSMYASSEFDMEPLLVDQKTELWQEQCMNQEPIYKHLQSLEARSCNTLRKGIHALLLQQKGYTNQEISKHYGVPMNHVRAWQSKARKYLQQDTKLYTLLS